ncbi:ribbon-helix-helix protein, CopG family [Haloplanus natans]|uniref:ribbon-helix-helix protein, CopG family n=1 Tax=Haloplanus natans TaxID=376171 RepID=UPI0006782584|nr:ribbon-helix-helix protein, CopG family [Haloplanus natans]
MKRLTVSLRDEHVERLEELVDQEGGPESKSEAVRYLIDEAERVESLEHDLEVAEARIEDLRRQMVERENIEEEVTALARRVEDQEATLAAPFFVRWYRYFRGDRGDSE